MSSEKELLKMLNMSQAEKLSRRREFNDLALAAIYKVASATGEHENSWIENWVRKHVFFGYSMDEGVEETAEKIFDTVFESLQKHFLGELTDNERELKEGESITTYIAKIVRKENIPRWARHKYGLGEADVVYKDKNKGTKEPKKIIQFPKSIRVDQEQTEEDGNLNYTPEYLCGVSFLDTDEIDRRRSFEKLDGKSKVLIALNEVTFKNSEDFFKTMKMIGIPLSQEVVGYGDKVEMLTSARNYKPKPFTLKNIAFIMGMSQPTVTKYLGPAVASMSFAANDELEDDNAEENNKAA